MMFVRALRLLMDRGRHKSKSGPSGEFSRNYNYLSVWATYLSGFQFSKCVSLLWSGFLIVPAWRSTTDIYIYAGTPAAMDRTSSEFHLSADTMIP